MLGLPRVQTGNPNPDRAHSFAEGPNQKKADVRNGGMITKFGDVVVVVVVVGLVAVFFVEFAKSQRQRPSKKKVAKTVGNM